MGLRSGPLYLGKYIGITVRGFTGIGIMIVIYG
jgi:hypothetical protein